MRRFLVVFLAFFAAPSHPTARADAREEKFIVHEWGVLVVGKAEPGAALATAAPSADDPPAFVLRHDVAYHPTRRNLGWDKPVLHFYGPEGLAVTVGIGTPLGRPLAYWPPPDRYDEKVGPPISNRREMMIYTLTQAIGMEWKGTLSHAPARPPADAPPGNWWSAVRDVPGAYFNAAKASERFIFYEATAKQDSPIGARVEPDAIVLRNDGSEPSGPVLAIVRDGRQTWGTSVDNIAPGGTVRLAKADVLAAPWDAAALSAACRTQWEHLGMTPQESRAIVSAWTNELSAGAGMLVLSRMPVSLYDKMFPLTITPRPDEVVRVGMVFDRLPAQDARLAWMPALRTSLEKWGAALASPTFAQRQEAERQLRAVGDLARPYLKELTTAQDPEAAKAAAVLLEELTPPPTPTTAPRPKQ